ncbi:MAG: hypothetical protein AABW80_00955 [Nanoarchaeota archaeon]
MAKYQFFQEPTKIDERNMPPKRIAVDYDSFNTDLFGLYHESTHYEEGRRVMKIGNCEGSLMVIDSARDTTQNPINKLHIGELTIRRPHAESYEDRGIKGFRVDLSDFDTLYARRALAELREWRNPHYRKQLLENYEAQRKPSGEYKWYCMPFRVAQLQISPQGLEEKIRELEERIRFLRQSPQRETRHFVSRKAREIERNCYTMVSLMGIETSLLRSTQVNHEMTKREARVPKVIVNTDVFRLAQSINRDLTDVFDFVCPQIDIERAKNYWQEMLAWRDQ